MILIWSIVLGKTKEKNREKKIKKDDKIYMLLHAVTLIYLFILFGKGHCH